MKGRLAVFARAPVFGKVKSRLAISIGENAALNCYRKLLDNTVEAVMPFESEIWIAGDPDELSWARGLPVRQQGIGDLGIRMLAAFTDGVKVLVGTDIPAISTSYIEQAFVLLEEHDVVVGPTEDGGYWLLAMHEPHESLFHEIEWGTNSVLTSTLAQAQNLSVGLCDVLWDVDVEEDYRRWLTFEHVRD